MSQITDNFVQQQSQLQVFQEGSGTSELSLNSKYQNSNQKPQQLGEAEERSSEQEDNEQGTVEEAEDIEKIRQQIHLSKGELARLISQQNIENQPVSQCGESRAQSGQRAPEFISICHSYNRKSSELIQKNHIESALTYLAEAQKLLEYAASSGKNIPRRLIFEVLHNEACCYQIMWDLEHCMNYVEALIFNLNSDLKITSEGPFWQFNLETNSAIGENSGCFFSNQTSEIQLSEVRLEKQNFKQLSKQEQQQQINQQSLLSQSSKCQKMLQLSKYYLLYCAINSQLKRNKGALESARKSEVIARTMLKNIKTSLQNQHSFVLQDKQSSKFVSTRTEPLLHENIPNETKLICLENTINSVEKVPTQYLPLLSKMTIHYLREHRQQLKEANSHHDLQKQVHDQFRNFSIGNIMQLHTKSSFDPQGQNQQDVLQNQLLASYHSVVEKVLILSISQFTTATELRYIAQERERQQNKSTISKSNSEDPDFKKQQSEQFKQSQVYHLMAILTVAMNIPSEILYLEHIVASYVNHYEKANIIARDSLSALLKEHSCDHQQKGPINICVATNQDKQEFKRVFFKTQERQQSKKVNDSKAEQTQSFIKKEGKDCSGSKKKASSIIVSFESQIQEVSSEKQTRTEQSHEKGPQRQERSVSKNLNGQTLIPEDQNKYSNEESYLIHLQGNSSDKNQSFNDESSIKKDVFDEYYYSKPVETLKTVETDQRQTRRVNSKRREKGSRSSQKGGRFSKSKSKTRKSGFKEIENLPFGSSSKPKASLGGNPIQKKHSRNQKLKSKNKQNQSIGFGRKSSQSLKSNRLSSNTKGLYRESVGVRLHTHETNNSEQNRSRDNESDIFRSAANPSKIQNARDQTKNLNPQGIKSKQKIKMPVVTARISSPSTAPTCSFLSPNETVFRMPFGSMIEKQMMNSAKGRQSKSKNKSKGFDRVSTTNRVSTNSTIAPQMQKDKNSTHQPQQHNTKIKMNIHHHYYQEPFRNEYFTSLTDNNSFGTRKKYKDQRPIKASSKHRNSQLKADHNFFSSKSRHSKSSRKSSSSAKGGHQEAQEANDLKKVISCAEYKVKNKQTSGRVKSRKSQSRSRSGHRENKLSFGVSQGKNDQSKQPGNKIPEKKGRKRGVPNKYDSYYQF